MTVSRLLDTTRLEPFKKFVGMLRGHLDGILSWTKHRVSNGAVEGMNNKIKSISHRSFGFRTAENFIAAIYHCCARLPLPAEPLEADLSLAHRDEFLEPTTTRSTFPA